MPRSVVKPFSKGSKKAKPTKKVVAKVKIETPETDVFNRIITLKDGFFPYGNLGLVNYHKKVKKGFTELDVLYPETLPPTKLSLQTVVDTQKKNFFTIYNSGWRLMYPTNYGMTTDFFSEYAGMVNRVHTLNFFDLFVSFREREKLWLTHYKKIFAAMPYELERFANSFRSTRTVIMFPEMCTYKTEYTNLLVDLWRAWKFPFTDYPSHITFRFYVFTSSIPGKTVRDKIAFIEDQHRHLKHMVCLVGDDVSLHELAVIAKKTEIRCTFDPSKCKDEGKFVKADSSTYVKMLKFSTPKASSINAPPLFFNKHIMESSDKYQKAFKYYSKISNVVLYT